MADNAAPSPIPIEPWPKLPFDAWAETCETLHRWTQVVGKVTLALRPFLNQWWQIGFQLTPRGMTTGTIHAEHQTFSINFDFVDHALVIDTSAGRRAALPLVPRSVASFYAEVMAALETLGIAVTINPLPVEIPNALPLDQDESYAAYDLDYVSRWWQIMLQTDYVLQRYRSSFVGKSSPTLFFWGSFDLNMTRFSGRPAPLPHGAPRFVQLAENQENISCGFWPGNITMGGVTLGEPAFYSYHYPEPANYREADVQPAAAAYHPQLGEFILPYEAVRQSRDPANTLLEFFHQSYEVGAGLANWDRATLEQQPPKASPNRG
jgi:hypothetical protein